MKAPDWYSRILLTAIAGLLAYVAAELRVLNQRYLAASTPGPSLVAASRQAYQPTAVALRQPDAGPAQATDKIVNVRIVGYQYADNSHSERVTLGTCYDCATGLPVTTTK